MYITAAYIVSFIPFNETEQKVFASMVKASLFVATFERRLQAWRAYYQEVDSPGYAVPYTLQIRGGVEILKRKLPLDGTGIDFDIYSVTDDPLLDDARKALINYRPEKPQKPVRRFG
jgi:hypothetical protein